MTYTDDGVPAPLTGEMAFDSGSLAWHFVRIRDGVPVFYHGAPVRTGERLSCSGPLELCRHGYHASWDSLSALSFAPGPVVCRVRVGCERIESVPQAQLVSRWREVVGFADASIVLRGFADWCAARARTVAYGRGCTDAAYPHAELAGQHAAWSAHDPVACAVGAALCGRIAHGAGRENFWEERNKEWSEQNDYLTARLNKLLGMPQ